MLYEVITIEDVLCGANCRNKNSMLLLLRSLDLPGTVVCKKSETDDQYDDEQAHPELVHIRGDHLEGLFGIDEAVDAGFREPIKKRETDSQQREFISLHHSDARSKAAVRFTETILSHSFLVNFVTSSIVITSYSIHYTKLYEMVLKIEGMRKFMVTTSLIL